MSYRRWRVWLETVGIAAVVGSLIFVGMELRLASDIAITDRVTTAADIETNLRDLLVENADLWFRGCADDDLTQSERTAFNQLVFAVYFKSFLRDFVNQTSLSSAPPDTFTRIIARNIYHYPGFRRAWEQLPKDQYSWEPRLKAAIQRLEAAQPEKLPIETCGLG